MQSKRTSEQCKQCERRFNTVSTDEMLPHHLIRLCSVVVFVFVVILVVFARRFFAVVIVIHVFPFVQAVLGRILVPEKTKEESNALWTRVENERGNEQCERASE